MGNRLFGTTPNDDADDHSSDDENDQISSEGPNKTPKKHYRTSYDGGNRISVEAFHAPTMNDPLSQKVLTGKALFQAFGEHQFVIQGNINSHISKYLQGSEYIVKIASGGHHTLLLTSLGRLLSFGKNLDGQLGVGDKTISLSSDIQQVQPLYKNMHEHAVDVCCGFNHSIVLTNLGNLMGCGWNEHGQLGELSRHCFEVDYCEFKPKIKMVRAGNNATGILDNKGSFYLSGTLNMQQCRLSEFTLMDDFSAKLSKGEKIANFQVGGKQVVAISSKNKVFVLGEDYFGSGGGSYKRFTNVTDKLPFKPSELKSFSVGQYHCLFLTDSGRVFATGYNGYGQLGTGDYKDLDTLTEVSLFYKIDPSTIKRGITASHRESIDYYKCEISKDAEIYTDMYFVDKNEYITSIHAGSYHSIFVSNLGTIYGCGFNAYGQLVLPTENEEKNADVKEMLIDTSRSRDFVVFSNSAANITVIAEKQAINLWMYKCLKNRAHGGELGDIVFSFDV